MTAEDEFKLQSNRTGPNLPARQSRSRYAVDNPIGHSRVGNIVVGNIVAGNIVAGNIVAGNIVAGNIIAENIVAGNIIAENIIAENIVAGRPSAVASRPSAIAGAVRNGDWFPGVAFTVAQRCSRFWFAIGWT